MRGLKYTPRLYFRGAIDMSRFLSKVQGEYVEEIESMKVCRWRINEVCCNEKCDCLGDYPDLSCDSKEECDYFEEEEGLI